MEYEYNLPGDFHFKEARKERLQKRGKRLLIIFAKAYFIGTCLFALGLLIYLILK